MTFVGAIINGSSKLGGAKKGGIVGDSMKIITKEEVQLAEHNSEPEIEIVDDYTKIDVIKGPNFIGYIGHTGDTQFVSEVLKFVGLGKDSKQLTEYGTRLAHAMFTHMNNKIQAVIGNVDAAKQVKTGTEAFIRNLSEFLLLAYDSSENNNKVRIGYVKWVENHFEFDYIHSHHYEIGHRQAKELGVNYLREINRRWGDKPPEEYTNNDIARVLAGQFVYTLYLKNLVGGIPWFRLLECENSNELSNEEGASLASIVGHWEWGVIRKDFWNQGERWLYEQIEPEFLSL